MRITSTAFEDGGTIPDQYSKDGGNERPPLHFENIPANARTLALIVDDPDAPHGLFTHWAVFNLPPTTHEIGGNMAVTLQQACNDFGQTEYGGPKPPSGEHRYYFKLFALDDQILLKRGASRLDMEEAMLGHVIEEAELMGRYAARSLSPVNN